MFTVIYFNHESGCLCQGVNGNSTPAINLNILRNHVKLYEVLRCISSYLDISFAEETTYYVYSYKGKEFRIFTQPSENSLYFEEFRFTLEHPRGNPKETAYFIYSEASSGHSFVTSKLDPSNYNKFPLDVVVLNNERVGRNSRRVYLIDRSNYGPMISLHDHGNVDCCQGKQTFSFNAHNATALGTKTPFYVFEPGSEKKIVIVC